MFIIKYLIILKTPKTRHQRELQWIVTKYYANIILSGATLDISFIYYFFWLFRAIPTAYGSFQARGQTGAAATSLCHSNAGSEPHLRFTPQQHWILNPLSGVRDQTRILMDTSWVHYCWAIMGTPRHFLQIWIPVFPFIFSCIMVKSTYKFY